MQRNSTSKYLDVFLQGSPLNCALVAGTLHEVSPLQLEVKPE